MLTHYRNDVEDNDSSRTPDSIDIVVGWNVRSLRLIRHMSQADLAEAMGLSFQQIQKYEKGENRIGASRIVKLARALEVHPGKLFEGTGRHEEAPIASALASIATPDVAKILHAYKAIACPKQKAAVLGLVRAMADAED